MTVIEEISRTDSLTNALEWATEVLRMRFEAVLELRDEALNSDDIEGVHRMRVAIRRLRSALRDFLPWLNSPLLTESKKELKRLADGLGQARDQDVAIAALEKFRAVAPNEKIKNGIEKMIEKRRLKRQKIQAILTEVLDPDSIENLREHFSKAIDETVQKNEKVSNLTVKEVGKSVISNNLEEFCDLSGSLYHPFNCEKLHELRIAAKRLRYALELFTVCWGEEISPFTKEVTTMQTFLGELHDCDLWIENLSRQLQKKKGKRCLADFWLLSKFSKERTKNYCAALCLWGKWQKNKLIKKLRTVLQNGD